VLEQVDLFAIRLVETLFLRMSNGQSAFTNPVKKLDVKNVNRQ